MGNGQGEVVPIVSQAVADALETAVDELPPLAEVVDPDALDALVPSDLEIKSSTIMVSFQYAGLDVVVLDGELVYARPAEEDHFRPVGHFDGDG